MVTARRITRSLGNTAAALALILLTSCTADRPTDPSVTGIMAAKGGGPPKVKSTDPSSAEQETTLDVRIFGSGFVEGSEARFLLDGVEVPGVKRNGNTQFVSASEVVANITIAVDAIIDLYDAEIRTPRGKKGVGADLFQVVEKGSGGPPPNNYIPLNVTFTDTPGDGILSDDGSQYSDGLEKVSAHLRSNPPEQPNWVFRLFTAFGVKRNENPIRKLCYDFGAGASGLPDAFVDGEGCDETSAAGPVGMTTSDPRDPAGAESPGGILGLQPTEQITMAASTYFEVDGFGWRLRYGRDCDGNLFGFGDSSRLTVTGGADNDDDGFSDVWTIEGSGPAILCKTPLKGKSVTTEVGEFAMPFLLTAVRQ